MDAGLRCCISTAAVAASRAKVRDAGCKCPVRKVDAEGELKAASDACNALVVPPPLAQVEEWLVADTYVDRLRGLFEPKENVEGKTEGEG
ncbi:hypothetical protein Hdeb2414_s0001g00024041 [Helianthus debilis subsp. tardiflorus]